jgi:hypothetical protein
MRLVRVPDTDKLSVGRRMSDDSGLQIFLWDFVLSALVLPVNGEDPPALAVIKKLKAVDAAHKRLGIVCIVTRFVSAPNVGDSAKLFGAPRDFCFVKPFLKKRLHPRDVSFDIQQLRLKIDVVSSGDTRSGHYARAGIKQRALAIPVALLSSRSGDHVIRSRDDCVDRLHVARISL